MFYGYYLYIYLLLNIIIIIIRMALYYGDWLRAWYPVNWMDFVAMAWFLSLVNTLIKAFYIVVLAILAIKEHDKI